MRFEKLLQQYNYSVSPALVAQKPAVPRDSAKLLVYDKKVDKISYSVFSKITDYLPKNTVLVFNKTKVVPARLMAKKETGGKVEIFYLKTVGALIEVMADRKITIGSKISLAPKTFFTVEKQKDKYYYLKPSFPIALLPSVLNKYGRVPLPPYLKRSPLSQKELKEQYQTVFAESAGSVAAPTASLHFTKKLLRQIQKAGIKISFVTLHINLGTFAPLTEENLANNKLHSEFFEIDRKTADFLNNEKKKGSLIIGVGTTVTRALESSAGKNGRLSKLNGATDLFIREGYQFKFVGGIITNFHVPRSSLLMLVAAFAGREKTLELYEKAAKKKFKFFSFGDGMLIY